ncbi:MAG: ABC transporter ATP-binding protein [Anaerolineae bacterium CG_4_9_14_3_um_filter_57_17]|nr:ABC transporter ATP-binding protein [bacterium]NCT22021.1 ABC transporter ATP-binding protein [bacterium]OIO85358.1 MAG: ABC transporter ATP-binding protein [Anaerolineae bacterium CG2_30_57_67]PJB66292.1 MAG: ABC transporter ATP-binding protein [Anaerolineae bacterium CG_4_9_14_3_um_filter_57_17]
MLNVSHLTVNYGAIEAVRDLSFEVAAGQVVAIIGANGAGKSTTLNTIGGILKPRSGKIRFDGHDISAMRADQIARLGLAQVPEGREVLAPLTVEENLRLGAYVRADREAIESDLQAMFMRFPILEKRRHQPAGLMSGGEQQMLAVARALMARPKLLTLDEPSMGLAPLIVNQIFEIISEIRAEGVTLLLVEQNARKALQVADYAYVLERGALAYGGPAAELRQDERIVAAYLGN